MARSREKTTSRFSGIDRRNLSAASTSASLHEALNVDLLPGGDVRRRDGLKKIVDLSPHSVGLYNAGGGLRAALPAGHRISSTAPIPFTYDVVGNTEFSATPLGQYVRVTASTTWGADSVIGAFPYLVLETTSGQHEHHWIRERPSFEQPFVNSRVLTPFRPGGSVLKMQGKLFSPDVTSGNVHFSSTEFGPSQWDAVEAPLDAGFIAPDHYSTGDINIHGLTEHNENLVVVMENSMQFWAVGPDPRTHQHLKTYTGPGTTTFGSLAKVIGDIFYFSGGGFRSLVTEATIGEQRESDFGEAIAELTRAFLKYPDADVRSIWSAARSQYICLFTSGGTTEAFCFTHSPSSETAGWTRWELPIAVEYIVEVDKELYVRAGNELFSFDPAASNDQVEDGAPVSAVVETNFDVGGARRAQKKWNYLDITQEGSCSVQYLYDDKNPANRTMGAHNLLGSTSSFSSIPIGIQSHSLALSFLTTDRDWRLASFTTEFQTLYGAG